MKKDIMRDVFFLGQRSESATEEDRKIIEDLKDTLKANRERCVGMAANMIGYRKRIIIVSMRFVDVVMVNPVILSKSQPYDTEEGCLSLDGVRKTKRFNKIRVQYQDEKFEKHTLAQLIRQIHIIRSK